jgi:hypothetical protein
LTLKLLLERLVLTLQLLDLGVGLRGGVIPPIVLDSLGVKIQLVGHGSLLSYIPSS